jgi:paraquat-inducible protein B
VTDQIPQTPVQPARRSLMDRVSIVWVIPIAALLIALGIAWQSYRERGALIEIRFQNASGIVADQTEVRYREVAVGLVEEVSFSDDLSHIVAHVRIEKQVEPFVDSEAVFWVVRPEVSARGVTGLSTVLSGVYIEGSWDDVPGGLTRNHTGLEEAPIARPDQKGRLIKLRSLGRGLNAGAPVTFKGLDVGVVGTPRLAADGASIEAEAFIFAPHDELLTSRSRFWNTSGISFNIGAGGASVDFASIASLINGGVSFETVVSGGEPSTNGMQFNVYSKQDEARASLFEGSSEGGALQLAVVFDQNVNGLKVGAPVTFRGLDIGEVISLSGRVDEEQFGDDQVRLVVVISIGLEFLQMGEDTDEGDVLDLFETRVAEGWRARLTKASLLTGGLKIEFVQIPDAAPATFERNGDPYPILPSAIAELPDAGGTAEGLLDRVNSLPVEELMTAATTFMENAAKLVASPELQQVPAEVSGLITDIRNVVASPGIQELPAAAERVADEVVALLDQLKESDGVGRFVAAIDSAGKAAEEVGTAVEGVPALLDQIGAVAEKAATLDIESLLAEAGGLVETARGLIGTDALRKLPEDVATALEGVNSAITEAGNLLTSLNANDSATRLVEAIEAASQAARGVDAAMGDVPPLLAEIQEVAAKAAALDLQSLLDEATGLAESANALLGSEGAKALPDSLNGALDEMDTALVQARVLMQDLNSADTVAKLSEAVAAAGKAATDIGAAVEGVPELIEGIDTVVARAALIDLNPLVEELTGLVNSTEALIGTEDAQALPASLNAALDEVAAAIEELRSGGTVQSVNAALASTRQAADSVAVASRDLPVLIRRTDAVLREAQLALTSLGDSGALNRQAQGALREVSRAADAVRSLARTIERKPNALLTGK